MTNEITEIEDANGNRATIAYWGSGVAAMEALATLTDCYNCVDCLHLVDCADCWRCERSAGLTLCGECVGCEDREFILQCSDCGGRLGERDCKRCESMLPCICGVQHKAAPPAEARDG